jgi:hypothetical protein
MENIMVLNAATRLSAMSSRAQWAKEAAAKFRKTLGDAGVQVEVSITGTNYDVLAVTAESETDYQKAKATLSKVSGLKFDTSEKATYNGSDSYYAWFDIV